VLVPLITSGKLRGLAVSSAERWPEIPDVPTFRESGLDGFPPQIVFGLPAPTGTPPDVIAKIDAAESTLLKSADTEATIAKIGLNPLVLSPQALAKILGDEVRLWKAVITEAGVHLD
jgi:tripartite-type tricarboxylate transporter receptor subunit TctC